MTVQPQHIVYVISHVQMSLAFEWIAMNLCKKYRLTFILLNPSSSSLETFLNQNQIDVKRLRFSCKLHYPLVFLKLFFYFLLKRPAVIHAHLLDAQLLGLTAAWLAGIKKRIYTRHSSTYHQVYFPKGVKYDRWSNRLATHIVSISQATYKTLTSLEKVDKHKIRQIHHGFDLSIFRRPDKEKIELTRSKWNIPETHPCIGVVARHIEWKGIQFIIPAFQKLLHSYPTAILVLANSHGPYHQTLIKQLAEIPESNYVLIPFEEDVASLYALFDLYVHAPVDELSEAFGQTYVEALAAEVPSIFTKSGIAVEFIEHNKNAWVVDYRSSDHIYNGMITLLEDSELRQLLKEEGKKSVQELFDIDLMITKLKKLYDD